MLTAGVWQSIDNGSRCTIQVHEIMTADKVYSLESHMAISNCQCEISHTLSLLQAGNVTIGKVDGAPARPDSPPPSGETATTGRIDDVTLV